MTVSGMAQKDELGRRGEDLAVGVLQDAGMAVIDRNWRCRHGEMDIVAIDHAASTVVFCEVKTRSGDGYGTPFEAVNQAKRRRLRAVAAAWLAEQNSPWVRTRFDVIGIRWRSGEQPTVEHRAEAF